VLQYVEVRGLSPGLILTDFHLRNRTADVIVSQIAERLKFKPPTIMLTGDAGQHFDEDKSIADRILLKPVDFNVLLNEIEQLLRKR
jgi:DNA-binding response OmpR family regulator